LGPDRGIYGAAATWRIDPGRCRVPARLLDDNPSMMNVIPHAYLSSGIPLIETFEEIIKYGKSRKEVWFARCGDIAALAKKFYQAA
jgi:hypothetical protein